MTPSEAGEFINLNHKGNQRKQKKPTLTQFTVFTTTTTMDFRASTAQDNAHRMIYIADLPRHTSYLDISDFYEKNIGPCQICIKR
jgi:hypothetical protein